MYCTCGRGVAWERERKQKKRPDTGKCQARGSAGGGNRSGQSRVASNMFAIYVATTITATTTTRGEYC